MDRGIWAAWYDLPDEGKEEYLAWLHEVHIPEALARPGYLWAAHVENGIWEKRESDLKNRLTYTDDTAVPAGNAYLMLYGAVSPHTFFDPSPSEMAENQTANTREMLGRRNGERSCIFTEEARVDGPEVATRAPGLTPGPIIQMGSFNSNKPANEEELGIWYAQWRLPSEGRMTGCVGARKLVSAAV